MITTASTKMLMVTVDLIQSSAPSLTHLRPLTTYASSSSAIPTRLAPHPPDLIRWVRRQGGFVHKALKITVDEESSSGLRLVASENVTKGSELISLPNHIPLCFPSLDSSDAADSALIQLARRVPG